MIFTMLLTSLSEISATLCQMEAQLLTLTTQVEGFVAKVDLVARDVKDISAHLKGRVHGAAMAD